ncbi:MAG: phosphoribosyltransferase [Treponema sp.]|jgi:hypoxanthine phosphoribosyltransferase|nr:phosphoribosyltransferase [Treponema sp.]
MNKEFLSADTMRNNALKMAHRIYRDGFIPDVIYVPLRGGALVGNVVSEYFKIRRGEGRPVYYAAVVARSYTGIRRQAEIKIEGWTYDPGHLRTGDKALVVDDIFDTGRTINRLTGIILEKGIPRNNIKIAVHDYKYFYDKPEQLPIQPDYWCRKHRFSIHDDDRWIHYLSHELTGLTAEELETYYYSQDPELRDVLSVITQNQ